MKEIELNNNQEKFLKDYSDVLEAFTDYNDRSIEPIEMKESNIMLGLVAYELMLLIKEIKICQFKMKNYYNL